jgi:hypothetical protein
VDEEEDKLASLCGYSSYLAKLRRKWYPQPVLREADIEDEAKCAGSWCELFDGVRVNESRGQAGQVGCPVVAWVSVQLKTQL